MQVAKYYKSLSGESKDKLLFALSTLLGTVLFFILFECLFRVLSYTLELAEAVFTVSYIIACTNDPLFAFILHLLFLTSLVFVLPSSACRFGECVMATRVKSVLGLQKFPVLFILGSYIRHLLSFARGYELGWCSVNTCDGCFTTCGHGSDIANLGLV
jgi:hypothetical protein